MAEVITVAVLEDAALTVEELACACAVSTEWVIRHVAEGALECPGESESAWRFSSRDLGRARRIVEGYFGAGGPEDEMRELIVDALDEDRVAERYLAAGERLAPHVVDGQAMVDAALANGEHVLLEGQLGTMRDLDWGIYPYVTSSSPIPGGASLGAGLPAVAIDRVLVHNDCQAARVPSVASVAKPPI